MKTRTLLLGAMFAAMAAISPAAAQGHLQDMKLAK